MCHWEQHENSILVSEQVFTKNFSHEYQKNAWFRFIHRFVFYLLTLNFYFHNLIYPAFVNCIDCLGIYFYFLILLLNMKFSLLSSPAHVSCTVPFATRCWITGFLFPTICCTCNICFLWLLFLVHFFFSHSWFYRHLVSSSCSVLKHFNRFMTTEGVLRTYCPPLLRWHIFLVNISL